MDAGTGADDSTADASRTAKLKTRRGIRTRIACLRCQTRKIRCDGLLPKCSACHKARADCVDGRKAHQDAELPRTYIAAFQNRIQWLESIVRARCPEIELADNNDNGQSSRPDNAPPPTEEDIREELPLQERAAGGSPQSPPTPPSLGEADASFRTNTNDPRTQDRNELAHEIGLVSMPAGTDPKYVGPSSGYSFAKLLFAQAGRRYRGSSQRQGDQQGHSSPSFSKEIFLTAPTSLPSSVDHAIQLSSTYFEFVHVQFPFLHQPSHLKLINHVYNSENPNPIASFQVNMLLAISTTVLSKRVKLPFSAEGFAVNAMALLEKFSTEHSLQGLQCVLLLIMYSLHSSFLSLNPWYLNYQCLASVLDLGLQRDVRANGTMTFLEQEMRTRIFWVIYTLDRTLATTMGRPIGLRDEACELRLPLDIGDGLLSVTPTPARTDAEAPTPMTYAIHLFKLAQLNSEIKYILHSISRDTPRYTFPQIPNLSEWQQDLLLRLQQWWKDIPQFGDKRRYLTQMCELKYHEIVMLLLRPSPRMRNPPKESMTMCHASAIANIRVWKELYQAERLTYSWNTVHSMSLSVMTMLYCIWAVPEIAKSTKIDVLMGDVRAGSNVLSAAGEYWPEAKKSRNILDELSNATVNWVMNADGRRGNTQISAATSTRQSAGLAGSSNITPNQSFPTTPAEVASQQQQPQSHSGTHHHQQQQQFSDGVQNGANNPWPKPWPWPWPFANTDSSTNPSYIINPEDLAAAAAASSSSFFGAVDGNDDDANYFDIDMTMQGIFNSSSGGGDFFEPNFDFGLGLPDYSDVGTAGMMPVEF